MEARFRLKQSQWIWFVVALGLSAGALIWIFMTGGHDAWLALRQVRPLFLVLALVIVAAMWAVEALRIHVMLKAMGEKLSYWHILEINLASAFLAGITPLAAGGPTGQTYFLTRRGVSLEKALAVVTTRVLLTILFFAALSWTSLLLFRQFLPLNPLLDRVVTLAALSILGGTVFFVYVIYRPEIVRTVLSSVLNLSIFANLVKHPEETVEKGYNSIKHFHDSLKLLLSSRDVPRLVLLIFYTLLFWGLFFAEAPVLLLGLGLAPPLLLIMVRQVVYYFIISYVPIPGGSGVAELGMASLFASVVPGSMLAGFVAGWRFLTYYINLIAGGIFFFRLGRMGFVK